MIIEYDESGKIFHVISDPVPKGMEEVLAANGHRFASFPPVPWPEEQAVDPDTGEPVLVPATDPDTGEPIYEGFETDPETGEPLFDENNEPVMRVKMVPLMVSNGIDVVECDMQRDYIVDGQITPRPECPAEVSVSGKKITISGAPEGSTFTVEFDDLSTDTEETEIELDEGGPVRITIRSPWPYLEGVHDLEIE